MPCGINTLCGISVPFGTLFPTERQVTHALLTRPPLTFCKALKTRLGFVSSLLYEETFPQALSALHKSARLACVRHAASVRPEPGSNSRLEWDLELRSLPDSILIEPLVSSK